MGVSKDEGASRARMLRDGCNASLTISVQGENINLVTLVDLRRMNRIVGISEAAAVLGGSISALRRSEAAHKTGGRTLGGEHRRYDPAKLRPPRT